MQTKRLSLHDPMPAKRGMFVHGLSHWILPAYLIFIAVVTALIGFYNLRIRSDWAMADWLINYSGGFVRRGLTGQLALTLSNAHLSPFAIILALQYLLYAVMLVAAWQLLRGARWSVWLVLLVFSPATLAFPILDPSFAFRKDILFLASLAGLLLLLRRRPVNTLAVALYVSAVCVVCVLSHEGLAPYMPYLIAAVAIAFRDLRRVALCALSAALCSAAASALVARFPGTFATSRAVCSSLGFDISTPPPGFCSGAITYLSRDADYAHAQVLRVMHSEHYTTLVPRLAVLSLVPVLLAAAALWRTRSARRDLLILGAATLLSAGASVVLFLYGTDWTRWIYLHVFSLFLLLLFLRAMHADASGPTPPHAAIAPDGEFDPYLPRSRPLRAMVYVLIAWYIFGWDLATYQPRVPLGGLIHYAVQQHRLAGSSAPVP